MPLFLFGPEKLFYYLKKYASRFAFFQLFCLRSIILRVQKKNIRFHLEQRPFNSRVCSFLLASKDYRTFPEFFV